MGGLFFTSDTHFRHRFVAGLRGFESAQEHDEAIVERWNATVGKDDTVWHLGDVGLGKPSALLPWVDRLNGTIHLITGNHDAVWPGHRDSFRHQREWLEHFASVQAYARRKLPDGRHVLLSHFPYSGDHGEDRAVQFRLRDLGTWLLHGHTHSGERILPPLLPSGLGDWRGLQVHVGLDAWGLRPASDREVMTLIDQAERDMQPDGAEARERLAALRDR